MMFLVGFICGLVFIFIGYCVLREIIFKYGKQIRLGVEKELNKLEDATKYGTQIVYPDLTGDIFNKENSTLEDLIKK